LRATWTGYYAPLQQNSDADKTKEEQRVYQSFGLLEKNLDAETQETEFEVVFTKNHENKQQDADVFMDSLFHTYMKNHPEKKISFRDIKSFCRETKQQLTEELKVKESNKRRIHNMISNARKLVILDDESDSDLSSQIKSVCIFIFLNSIHGP
jgi:D-hexose-6-phosphate mutarotase